MGIRQSRERLSYITTPDAVIINGYCWFADKETNALYKWNILNEERELVTILPLEYGSVVPVMKLITRDNKLYMCSLFGVTVWIYDMQNNDLQSCSLNRQKIEQNNQTRTSTVIEYGNQLWCIPRYLSKGLFIYDFESQTLSEHISFNHAMKSFINEGAEEMFCVSAVNVGDYLYMPVYNKNRIVRYDMKTGSAESYIFDEKYHLHSAAFDGENVWVTLTDKDALIVWNLRDGVWKEILVGEKEEKVEGLAASYSGLFYSNGYIVASPGFCHHILLIDTKDFQVKCVELDQIGFDRIPCCSPMRGLVWGMVADGSNILFLPGASNMLVCLDLNTLALHGIQTKRNADEMKIVGDLILEGNKVYHEEAEGKLEDWIHILENYSDKNKMIEIGKSTYGKKIHNKMMGWEGKY